MTLNETFSPVLHRIDQAIRWRAVHPNEPIPPPYEILTRYSQPPELLIEGAKPHLERSIATANVKKGTYNSLHKPPKPPEKSNLALSPPQSSKPQTHPKRHQAPLRTRRRRPPRQTPQNIQNLPHKPNS